MARYSLYLGDCMQWMDERSANSVQAIVTDPPYPAEFLPVWGEMMAALEPEPVAYPQPEDIELDTIDPQSGLLADSSCPGAIELPFVKGSAPKDRAACAGNPVVDNVKSFFQRLFGK